ncbi:phosphatase PAP2 family protein [Aeromicrobium sp. S22]|uniref:phosphatase PAP2 family protein n=1 Tax=Aeromicrobium sp. S22 TaxID=2662029 RepID=UPI00129D8392|nr:phosphatase PAP2 family protein [Aeromicrobium sp. S22]MRJ99991.1 phosphatase PAP2 family protein [Aeromicrobium sp. S22]
MTTLSTGRDTARTAAVTALAGAASLVALVVVALHSARGQGWDDSAMDTVVGGRDAQLTVLSVLGYVSIGAIVIVVVGCALVALLRGRATLALAAVVVIAGSNVTTQVLKHTILDRPDLGLGTLNSLPSGHTTVVASSVGAALLVAPRLTRPFLAAAGGFATTLTGASTVVAGWHRPADVLAALAVSLTWTATVAFFVHGPARSVAGTFIGAVIGCAGALAFLVAVGVRPVMGWDGFIQASLVLGAVTAATVVFVLAASAVSPAE